MDQNRTETSEMQAAGPEGPSLGDLLDILRRRRWEILIPAIAIFGLAAVAAFVLPRKYVSTTTILIEEQEIPREYVAANITSFADQRLQTINQKIMSSTRLLDLIGRFNLYGELKDKQTMDAIVEKMRKDIKFATISADVVDPRTGRPAQATIAFSVSYNGKNPETVQKVASELASLYLEENLKTREKQSSETSKFMDDEMKDVQAKLAEVDRRVSAYKQRNISSLPELTQVNLQGLDQVEREIVRQDDQLRTLREREGYLQQQLAATSPDLRVREKESLKALQVQLAELKSRFSDEYPDVIKMKAAIRELERQVHVSGGAGDKPENPAYVTLASQLAGTQSEIESVKRQVVALQGKRDMYNQRVMSSPRVEEGYKTMLFERNNLQAKFDELTKKSMDAKVAHGLEKEQLGERFSIVDAARLPDKPASPNVPAILLIGLVLGLGSGVGLAAVRESGDDTVRGAEALAAATGLPVLSCIPEIVTAEDAARKTFRTVLVAAGSAAAVAAVLVAVHYFVMDLDVVMAKIMRKLPG